MNSKVETLSRQPAMGANIANLEVMGQLQGMRLLSRLSQWRHNRKTREQLARMPEYLLKDIGLGEEQLQGELNKRFWQD